MKHTPPSYFCGLFWTWWQNRHAYNPQQPILRVLCQSKPHQLYMVNRSHSTQAGKKSTPGTLSKSVVFPILEK